MTPFLFALLSGLACTGEHDKGGVSDDSGAGGDSGETGLPGESGDDSGTPAVTPPCADGGWGAIGDPDSAVHVSSASGSPDGDGSAAAPVDTLEAALAIVAAGGPRTVAFWPGRYAAPGYLDATWSGLALTGCSSGEVVLEGGAEESAVHVAEATDVHLAALTVEGGRRAVRASAGARVVLEDLIVSGSVLAGVVIDGHLTTAELHRVAVTATADEAGYGVGLLVDGATGVVLEDVEVSDSVGVGVLVSDAEVEGTRVTVRQTAPTADGAFGRGVQVQLGSVVSLVAADVTDSQDAGVFVLQAVAFTLSDSVVDGVAAGTLDDGTPTGDGVVVSSDDGDGPYDPALFAATLSGNAVRAVQPGRAGVFVEGVTVAADGNDVSGELLTDGAVLTGDDAASFTPGAVDVLRTIPDTAPLLVE